MAREKHGELLSRDLMKCLTDNLSLRYPALVEGIVPEKISYGLLQEAFRRILGWGCSLAYLPKIIEAMENVLYDHPGLSSEKLSEQVHAVLMPDEEKLLI